MGRTRDRHCGSRESSLNRFFTMGTIFPPGYISFREAAADLEAALFMGTPERPAVVRVRKKIGFDVGDRKSQQEAVDCLWAAVDRGRVPLVGVGGPRRSILQLPSKITKSIPLMRNPSVCDFSYLRPSHKHHGMLFAWFGVNPAKVQLAVRETDVSKLAKHILRTRRRLNSQGRTSRAGRPSLQIKCQPAVKEIIEGGKWQNTESVKKL